MHSTFLTDILFIWYYLLIWNEFGRIKNKGLVKFVMTKSTRSSYLDMFGVIYVHTYITSYYELLL